LRRFHTLSLGRYMVFDRTGRALPVPGARILAQMATKREGEGIAKSLSCAYL
jgi:hypothetical protein